MGKCYSLNDEYFNMSEIGDVIDALECDGRLEVGTIYYEADSQPLTLPKLLRADKLLEQADETGYDLVGECWDNPFSVSKAAEAELQELLNAWAAKHVDVSRYHEIVGKSRELRITEADLPANNVVEGRASRIHHMPRRRHGLQSWYAPRRFEPESLLDAWPFLVCALVIAGGILWARSQGWLP